MPRRRECDDAIGRRAFGLRRVVAAYFFAGSCALALACPSASATATQEEVFRSIQDNVNEPASGAGAMPFLLAGTAVVILLALFTQRRKRAHSPQPANHPGKLLKEVLKTVPLRSSEVKQLKLLVESSKEESGPTSPLTLVLCPSVLAKAIRKAPVKADREVLDQLAKKTGAAVEPVPSLQR